MPADGWEPHCIPRARERYGVELTTADLEAMVDMIQGGRAILMTRGIEGGDHYLVRHAGTVFHLVYEPFKRRIITFLPPGASRQRALDMRGTPKPPKRSPKGRCGARPKRCRRPSARWDEDGAAY